MRNKKLLCTLVTIFMLITMISTTVFAAGEGSITVTNTNTEVSISDNIYSAYKIFDVTYNTAVTAFIYTIDPNFTAFFTAKSISTNQAAFDYVNTADPTAFAKEAFDYINAEIAAVRMAADGSATVATESESCTISNLNLGYYLVNGTANPLTAAGQTVTSLCMLNTTTPDVTVNPKLDVPTIDKQVKEDSLNEWGEVADYTIGESVPFRTLSSVPDMNGYSSYKFIVHDTMSAGLTFNNDVAVTIGGTPFTDITVTRVGQAFQVVFGTSFISQTKDAAIVITYSATLNDDAVLFDSDNSNEVYLEYSNNPYNNATTANTPIDTVLVDTYKVDIIKFTGEFISANYLADAHFELKLTNVTTDPSVRFVSEGGSYRVATAAEIASGTVTIITDLVSDANGKIVIKGIDEGTYYLFETEAPVGYNILEGAVKITLARDFDTGNYTTATDVAATRTYADDIETGTINVQNNAGVKLPITGGIGTTIFTITGLVLMTGVVVAFVTRKKLSSRKK